VCNTGVGLSPAIDGTIHHFSACGLYNGLFLLGDRESGSYWDHITGECVHGPLKGHGLDVFPLLHTTITQALATHRDVQIALSSQSLVQRLMGAFMEWGRKTKRGVLPPGFKKTMGEEDRRCSRMDIGLGVWDGGTHRYYPLARIRRHGGALLDELEGQRLLVYIDPISGAPAALYTDSNHCIWKGNVLYLDTGENVRDSAIRDAEGVLRVASRPMQMFTRWYGFAYTFPGCQIYEG
jgi:hypothetical protein